MELSSVQYTTLYTSILAWLGVLILIDFTFLIFRLKKNNLARSSFSHYINWLIESMLRKVTLAPKILVFTCIESYIPWSITPSAISWVVGFLLVDFLYYWKHRLLHRYAWGLHLPHHTPRTVTVLSSLRSGWIQRTLIDDLFYAPLLLVGFNPLALVILGEVNLSYQAWIHNEWIGKIKGLDKVLNTPSNHRVHHAIDRKLCDHNYGSVLIIWDKLFGTYLEEPENLTAFGVAEYPDDVNIFKIQFAPFTAGFQKIWRPK